jgi:glycine/D-amino acid oxidase-like deaminating enzyme
MTPHPNLSLPRRRLLQGSAAFGGASLLGLGGCATAGGAVSGPLRFDNGQIFAPVRATKDRLFDITVCLRPFRAAGPRLDTETIGDALIVHNYGHGGSGWSLSWGSGTVAVKKAMANSPREIAVVGCGALGLTAAILAQRAGAAVTIYAMEQTPQTRSARATGSWTPDSRIALTDAAGPKFGDLWEAMARTSFKAFRSYLGLPGDPVEWRDRYNLSDQSPEQQHAHHTPDPLGFAHYEDRLSDLEPKFETLPPGSTPFATPYVRRASQLQFNVADYAHTLLTDFYAAGGKFERREFHSPSELATLKEKVVINCPGYAARALWKDESVVPVRGQIGWLIPQPELTYGLYYNGVSVVSRRDGIVVQVLDGGDMRGYGDANETPDRAESEAGVALIAELYERSRAKLRA